MNTKKILLVSAVLIIVIASFVALVYFLRTNTSLLSPAPSEEVVNANNSNDNLNTVEENELVELVPRELITHSDMLPTEDFDGRTLNLPVNFQIEIYAAGLGDARAFTFGGGGMFITDRSGGRLLLVRDITGNGVADGADDILMVDEDLNTPHGVFWFEDKLYLAEEHQVVVYSDFYQSGVYRSKDVLISDLPTGGHSTRTVVIGPDRKIYLSVGSSCNVCEEDDERRAAISRYDLNGNFEKVYASGLRNTVGMVFHLDETTLSYGLWGVDNGRDQIGDDIPPEEVNLIREDGNYGWPYCYGASLANPEYADRASYCRNENYNPAYSLQAHSAPLGLSFLNNTESLWPDNLDDNLFVAFHGSWNRTVPTGYKLVRIDPSSDDAQTINFITGWIDETGDVWGRPVHVDFDSTGDMYISDDLAGVVYRVSYTNV
jgi:glucose/arabinose dehydrogenase